MKHKNPTPLTKNYIFVGIILLLSVITTIVFNTIISSEYIQINLTLSFILLITLTLGLNTGVIFAFFAGLLLDLFTPIPYGTSSLALISAASILGFLQQMFYRRTLLLYMLLIFLITFINDTIIYTVVVIVHQSKFSIIKLFSSGFIHSIINFLGLLILLKPFKKAISYE